MPGTRPNPGSQESIALGCICAVLDNNHGKWAPFPATADHAEGWWITEGCPVHVPRGSDGAGE